MSLLAERCRIVLVRPQIAANIGAAARVMKNFGLKDLRLVDPHADPLTEEARKLSTHGEAILHQARSFSSFLDAVGDCIFVAGTSARTAGVFRSTSVAPPHELMPRLVETLSAGSAALVFGSEQTGLLNCEVERCHYLMHIPTDENYPALNLAQSVAICLYELRKAWNAATGRLPITRQGPATAEAQERMFLSLEEALRDLHFLWGDNADALRHALRHLIARAQPTTQEVDLLFGLARQIHWYANQHRDRPAS
jgi:tRNA/rRNA methyltransferase